MLDFLQDTWLYLHDANVITFLVRIGLAALAGGVVGLERELHSRAAGLRTHMLVALGAALSALIGVYLSEEMAKLGVSSDAQRTGAQVMSGIGFLGAGTILVKKGNSRITGLTTAAGLWATAAIGLAMGYGLYVPSFTTALIAVFAFTVISKLEARVTRKRRRLFVYLEIDNVIRVKEIIALLQDNFGAIEIQVTIPRSGTAAHVGIETLVHIPPRVSSKEKIKKLEKLDHVVFAIPIT
ncbi:MAG: MgtC/SapB family protein [Clostridia bacterium]|nr:MgtC/SapB family protein [Clostridia bacterium]